MPTTEIVIRRATTADLSGLGRLGALLVRAHYEFDRHRFMEPRPNVEDGYAWFLGTQLADEDVAVFVAERKGTVVGYVYAGIEPQSWKELREEAGFIHDIVVKEQDRRTGIAAALIREAIEWLRARGMPRVMLCTAAENTGAQHLFARLGFRRTMVEMTLETPPVGLKTDEK